MEILYTNFIRYLKNKLLTDEISIRTMPKQTENDILWIFHLTNKKELITNEKNSFAHTDYRIILLSF